MRGCRPLTFNEFKKLIDMLERKRSKRTFMRDKALLVLMISTGLRVGEVTQIRIQDVCMDGVVGDYINVPRKITKGKVWGASLPLAKEAKDTLQEWINYSGAYAQEPSVPLFPPSCGGYTKRPVYQWGKHVTTSMVRNLVKKLQNWCFLQGNVSTHSMRKTYAKLVYEALDNDLMGTQQALRHSNINSTICYLQTNDKKVSKAISQSFSNFAKAR